MKTQRTLKKPHALVIAACLVMMPALVACSPGKQEQPKAPGLALLDAKCSVCHGADRPKNAKKSKEQWEETVTRMIGKGAQISEAEKPVLIDYLVKNHGL